jgi:hypothetical protein
MEIAVSSGAHGTTRSTPAARATHFAVGPLEARPMPSGYRPTRSQSVAGEDAVTDALCAIGA